MYYTTQWGSLAAANHEVPSCAPLPRQSPESKSSDDGDGNNSTDSTWQW